MSMVKGTVAAESPKPFKPSSEALAKIKLSPEQDALIDTFLGGAPASEARAGPAALKSARQTSESETASDRKAAYKAAFEKPEPPRPAAEDSPEQKSPGDFSTAVERARRNLERKSAEPPVAEADSAGKRLSMEDLESAAKALQLLVRHRGGGPFGAGRLRGAEAGELASALREAADMLQRDFDDYGESAGATSTIAAAAIEASAPSPKVPSPSSPTVPKAPAPEKVSAAQPLSQTRSAGEIAVPKVVEQSLPEEVSEPVVMTIAQGLDAFLLDKERISTQDLLGLRDGVIQCLGLIQSEIMSRSQLPAAPVTPSVQPPAQEKPAPVLCEDESLERQIKITLGLLLKHRGGPGFGHGRLQGQELDVLEQRLKAVASALVEESTTADESAERLRLEKL